MKRTGTLIFLMVLLGSGVWMGCKPKRDPNKVYFNTPAEYNDFIVKEQKEVMAAFDDFAGSVNEGNIDSMGYYHAMLSKRARLAQASIGKMADYEGDTLFRTTALDLFGFVNTACETDLKEIIMLAAKDSSITETDIERISQLSESYTQHEKIKNDALINAQAQFTEKFHVSVQ